MSARPDERLGIIGLGAVGGSLALAWRDRARVIAWSRDGGDRASARETGILVSDEAHWRDDLASRTVIVVAVPASELAAVLRDVMVSVPDECLLLHTTSLQHGDALGLSRDVVSRVLGTHPIAGSERSGFSAADGAMFRGATLRAEARASADERDRIEALWRSVGISRIIWDDAAAHDSLMSWVSHLPQLTSTALAAVLANRGIAPVDVGPGARDATRLASSDPTMWMSLLWHAPRETVEAIECLTSSLEVLRTAIEGQDAAALAAIWENARAWRAAAEKRS
jgi:prephenate dehydrogenase